jgi:hypothetical protein
MPMKLKSFGCSFVFGTDLADDGRNLPMPTPSQHTWPANLARKMGYDYECYARPGSGNLQIAERVLTHWSVNEPAFFVIGWTWIDRFDYTNSTINNDPIQRKWHNWRTLMPIDNDALAKTYFKGLHSEYRDKLTSLMSIKLVIDTLNQHGIPFMMTFMDDLLFDDQKNHTPAVLALQKFVRPYMTTFEGKNFLEWSRSNGYPESKTWHPLEPAHHAAGEYMFTVFDKQNTNGPTQQVLF